MNVPKGKQDTRFCFVENCLEIMDFHIDKAVDDVENDCITRQILRSTIHFGLALEAHGKVTINDLDTMFSTILDYGISDAQLDSIKEIVEKHCYEKLLATAEKANTVNMVDIEDKPDFTKEKKMIGLSIDININRIKNKRDVEKAVERRNTRLVIVGWAISIALALASIPAITDLLKVAVAAIKATLTKQP